jgi:prepilin-type N-terminal cleavage/methylation domain-containing protein
MLLLSDHSAAPARPRTGRLAQRDRRAVSLRQRRGFSLVELLVVLGVVLLLVGILVPVASSVRQQAKETTEAAAARSVLAG